METDHSKLRPPPLPLPRRRSYLSSSPSLLIQYYFATAADSASFEHTTAQSSVRRLLLQTFESSLANDAVVWRGVPFVCAVTSFCYVFRMAFCKTLDGQSANGTIHFSFSSKHAAKCDEAQMWGRFVISAHQPAHEITECDRMSPKLIFYRFRYCALFVEGRALVYADKRSPWFAWCVVELWPRVMPVSSLVFPVFINETVVFEIALLYMKLENVCWVRCDFYVPADLLFDVLIVSDC